MPGTFQSLLNAINAANRGQIFTYDMSISTNPIRQQVYPFGVHAERGIQPSDAPGIMQFLWSNNPELEQSVILHRARGAPPLANRDRASHQREGA